MKEDQEDSIVMIFFWTIFFMNNNTWAERNALPGISIIWCFSSPLYPLRLAGFFLYGCWNVSQHATQLRLKFLKPLVNFLLKNSGNTKASLKIRRAFSRLISGCIAILEIYLTKHKWKVVALIMMFVIGGIFIPFKFDNGTDKLVFERELGQIGRRSWNRRIIVLKRN